MKKSNTLFKSIFAVILSCLLMMSTVSSAFAALIVDEEEKLQYLYSFNNAVNGIKENKPSFRYQKTAGMDKDAEVYYDIKTPGDLSDDALRWLDVFIKAFFNPEAGVINNFIAVLTETDSDVTEKEIAKGLDTTYFLPKYGESYVSALTLDDEYTLKVEEKTDILNPENNTLTINYDFPEYDLGNVEGSSLEKVFDLPSGSINPVIIGGAQFDDDDDPLTEVKFDDFTFTEAYVRATLDANGELKRYEQNISYEFSVSFYDVIRLFNVLTGVNLMSVGMTIANTILKNLGNEEMTERDVLKKSMMYIKYDINTVLSDFDWNPRVFGDVDNDGDVDAYDARTILRYSVGLDKITGDENLIYSDVNFDGVINAADARFVLRTSVSLEDSFSEVPEGESIKIIVITPPEEPEPPETPENPENPEDPDDSDDSQGSGTAIDGVNTFITGFIDGIFAIINAGKGDEFNPGIIEELKQAIKDIVSDSKNDDDGTIILPDQPENT